MLYIKLVYESVHLAFAVRTASIQRLPSSLDSERVNKTYTGSK